MSHAPKADLKQRPLPHAMARTLAAMCKAAADPLRLDIMRVLSMGSFGVQELAAIFAMPQPGMSHHLKVLAQSGLLLSRRQGNSIFYRRSLQNGTEKLQELHGSLLAAIDVLPLAQEYQERIDHIYEERAEQSRLFFERNAARFEENQGMLCELGQYLANLQELVDLINLPRESRVMEIGPGQGQLLLELARRFDTLVALDNSEEMLAVAKGKAPLRGKVRFHQCSLESYEPPLHETCDLIVMNMVLHHMSSPIQAFQKLRRLLGAHGYLVIADLCPHHQEWARTVCGDIWFGFDPKDLQEWAQKAGFVEEQSSYLGLKNGFQIQLKMFRAI